MGDPGVNAFTMPGGYIGVNLGLVLLTQSESELASVLSHEMAHVTQKHYARMMDDQRKTHGSGSPVGGCRSWRHQRAKATRRRGRCWAPRLLRCRVTLNFSRDNEREADRIGFQYLACAQFDPAAMGVFT